MWGELVDLTGNLWIPTVPNTETETVFGDDSWGWHLRIEAIWSTKGCNNIQKLGFPALVLPGSTSGSDSTLGFGLLQTGFVKMYTCTPSGPAWFAKIHGETVRKQQTTWQRVPLQNQAASNLTITCCDSEHHLFAKGWIGMSPELYGQETEKSYQIPGFPYFSESRHNCVAWMFLCVYVYKYIYIHIYIYALSLFMEHF